MGLFKEFKEFLDLKKGKTFLTNELYVAELGTITVYESEQYIHSHFDFDRYVIVKRATGDEIKNSNLYKVVEEIGIDNIVLETDSPYLAPVPFRGLKNSSKYIPIIAECVAEILNISVEKVRDITSNNACCLFDLN